MRSRTSRWLIPVGFVPLAAVLVSERASGQQGEAPSQRDPFRSAVTGPARNCLQFGAMCVEHQQIKLTGVVGNAGDYRALVETPSGSGFVLRIGDVIGGDPPARVAAITPQGMTLELESGGQPREKAENRLVEFRLRPQ